MAERIKGFFNNIWTKRVVSLLCTGYTAILVFFAYMSVFYDIHVTQKKLFVWLFAGVSLFFVALMLYTRKQLWTRLLSIIMVPLLLPVFLFNFGEWFLVIPFAVVVIFMFFACGASESTKTVWGTIFLLCYILSTLAYFVFTTIFDTSANLELERTVVSQSGKYRANVYSISSTIPNKAQVFIEPNDKDKNYKYFEFVATGYEKICYTNTAGSQANVEWVIDEDGVERLYLADEKDRGAIFDTELDANFPWSFLIFEFGTEDEQDSTSTAASGKSSASE
ncbi:MAG: hypothetical protein IJO29_08155 [Oscillospiraceae bacterium]|nr:hypothetical protein [Oscillospiraceae bacterium]